MNKELIVNEINEVKSELKRNLLLLNHMKIRHDWLNSNIISCIRQIEYIKKEVNKDDEL